MIGLIIQIAIVGLVVWAIQSIIPMDARFQRIIYVIAVICVVLIVLSAFGLLPANTGIHLRQ